MNTKFIENLPLLLLVGDSFAKESFRWESKLNQK